MLFIWWWCFDDHLATLLHNPDLGTAPWWLILLISIIVDAVFTRNVATASVTVVTRR